MRARHLVRSLFATFLSFLQDHCFGKQSKPGSKRGDQSRPHRSTRDQSMSGVWVFKNGVAKLVQNPSVESLDGEDMTRVTALRPKELVFTPSDEVMTDHDILEEKLLSLGWEIYDNNDDSVRQYHKSYSPDLITLPADFSNLKTVHMYDIVVKCRSHFQVRDADES